MNKISLLIGGAVLLLAIILGLRFLAAPAGDNGAVTTPSPLISAAPAVLDALEAMQEEQEAMEEQGVMMEATTSPAASPAPASASAGVKEFTVTGRNFSFTPSELRVQQGDTVRVTFTSKDGFHDWRLDEFNVGTPVLQTGQSETVEFVAAHAGQFEYYCSVGNHRAMGMKGTLIVE